MSPAYREQCELSFPATVVLAAIVNEIGHYEPLC